MSKSKQKVYLAFAEVPEGEDYYIKRYPDGVEADSLHFIKRLDGDYNSWNKEFGHSRMVPWHPCWRYVECA